MNSVGLQTTSEEHLGQKISAYVIRSIRAQTKSVRRNQKGFWERSIGKNKCIFTKFWKIYYYLVNLFFNNFEKYITNDKS